MNASLQLESRFSGGGVPAWLRSFEEDPENAVETLLMGGADLGHLQVVEPVSLLLGWLRFLEGSDFVATFDRVLASWIGRRWGHPRLPRRGATAALTATGWLRAMELIGQAEELTESARQLRSHFPDDRPFLRAMSEGPSRDPEGRAWLAVARHQTDDSLRESWWTLCSLPPDVPWYHGEYGVDGLRHLFPPGKKGIAPQVAEGLLRLADGLAGRVEDGWLNERDARAEFQRLARTTSRAYPFPERWTAVWRSSGQKCRQELARSWAEHLLPAGGSRKPVHPPPWLEQPDPRWPQRSKEIGQLLHRGATGAVEKAWQLIQEQAEYARATGDNHDVPHTLCNLAAKVGWDQPELAIEWAAMARSFNPWDVYGWTVGVSALLKANKLPAALQLAMQAIDQFPENSAARSVTAEVLIRLGRLDEAERLYRETIARFPEEIVPRNALAHVMRRQRRMSEAESLYRETLTRFSDRQLARAGLGDMARAGLADVLMRQKKFREAENLYGDVIQRFPPNVVPRCGLAEVMRHQGRLAEAEKLYREIIFDFPDELVPRDALATVLISQRRWQDAKDVLLETVNRFSSDVRSYLALASCARAEGRLDEAKEWYRVALKCEPENVLAQRGLAWTDKHSQSAETSTISPEDEQELMELFAREGPESFPSVIASELESAAEPDASGVLETLAAIPLLPVVDANSGLGAPQQQRSMRQSDIQTLILDSHLLRRWARPRSEEEAGKLAERARQLLEKFVGIEEVSALAASEGGLLRLESKELDATISLLRKAAERFPGSVRVRYTLARAEREAAGQERRSFNEAEAKAITQPWQGLVHLDERLGLAKWLGLGRAWLALQDGHRVQEEARRNFVQLGDWVSKTRERERGGTSGPDRSFTTWWANQLDRYLFGGKTVRHAEDLADMQPLEENIYAHRLILDDLEESFVYRHSIT